MKNSKLITIIRQEKFNKQIKPIIFFVNQETSKPCYICALSFDGHVEASLDYYLWTNGRDLIVSIITQTNRTSVPTLVYYGGDAS